MWGRNKRESGKKKRRAGGRETHREDTKFKGTGSKARNPWAMTVSFQGGKKGREFFCL